MPMLALSVIGSGTRGGGGGGGGGGGTGAACAPIALIPASLNACADRGGATRQKSKGSIPQQ
jgi:hypothetical protein